MQRTIILFICAFFCNAAFSQIIYEKGYFVTNSGERIECLIRNSDWGANPTGFMYKLSENSEAQRTVIDSVQNFGVYNGAHFERHTVDLDISAGNGNIENLSTMKDPVFESKTLFLKVMVKGNTDLLSYKRGNLNIYFYRINPNGKSQQLIYKRYLSDGGIRENRTYLQQLASDIKIAGQPAHQVKYNDKELTRYFMKYNGIGEYSGDSAFHPDTKKRDFFNLNLRAGLRYSTFRINNAAWVGEVDFGGKYGIRAGVEAEFILPFNKGKWTLMAEGAYQYYTGKRPDREAKINCKSIEIPVGMRYYFFLSEKSKIYLTAQWCFNFTIDSYLTYYGTDVKLGSSGKGGLAFSAGYQYRRFGIEARYETNRNVVQEYLYFSNKYNSVSLNLTYRL